MTNVNDETANQGIHMIVGFPGQTKDVEVSEDGMQVAILYSGGDLDVTFKSTPAAENEGALFKGPISRFALRPRALEVAIVSERGDSIYRYQLQDVENPSRVAFSKVSAIAYNQEGSLLAAGNEYGKILIWNLEKDGGLRPIVESKIGNERIVRLYFGFHCLIVLTERGRCYRLPFHFASVPKVLVQLQAEDRLVAGDGKPFDWNCYAYAHHPTLSLEAFGGECGLLISQHEIFGLCGVKRTGLGRFIHKLSFCTRTGRLVAMGEEGVQIWSVHTTVMHEKWQVAGDLSKLGRAAAAVKFLEESHTAPEAGLKPLAYAVLGSKPTIFWG